MILRAPHSEGKAVSLDKDNIIETDTRITVVADGGHVIYDLLIDADHVVAWRNPLYIMLETNQKNEPILQFRPLMFYSETDAYIDPVPEHNCLATYSPAQEVIKARDKFIEDFKAHQRKNEMSSANVQATMRTSSPGNPTLH